MESRSVEPAIGVPPQVPVYHFQCAPAPRLAAVTPFMLMVMLSPTQMLLNGLLEESEIPLIEEELDSVIEADPMRDDAVPLQRESDKLDGVYVTTLPAAPEGVTDFVAVVAVEVYGPKVVVPSV